MTESSDQLKTRLIRRTGLTDSAITAAWPDWWTDAAEHSPSAQTELRFSLARKLGLDARSLVEGDEPRFIWNDSARFKGFSGNPNVDKPVIGSFGTALTKMLLQGVAHTTDYLQFSASELRRTILDSRLNVGLIELIKTAWSLGIPVVHLRVYPLSAKRMSAMCIRVGHRFAILMARDARYPAPLAFHLAHEIGHILLGHLRDGESIVDLESVEDNRNDRDAEEREADTFALELLTGRQAPEIDVQGGGRGARQLASEAIRVGQIERIEPGTLALAYGYATKNWDTANRALTHIYDSPYDAWRAINQIAMREMRWDSLSDEAEHFIRAVMGSIND